MLVKLKTNDESMSDQEVLSTKEALLDHIYAVVHEFDSVHASRITGMLTELPASQLMVLLGNKQLLKQKASQALETIKSNHDDRPSQQTQQLHARQELYQQVRQMEPALCEQITEVLMEFDDLPLGTLLKDPDCLREAVDNATDRLQNKSEISEQLADRIYQAVSIRYPRNAPKITGMLREMNTEVIKGLVATSGTDRLTVAANSCKRVLQDTNQWINE